MLQHYETVYYLTYLGSSVALIFWLARILHRAGGVFLDEAFHGNTALVRAVAQLLDVGFYLISFGWVASSFQPSGMLTGYALVGRMVCQKVGGFLLLMGFVHLFNMLLLAIFRHRSVRIARAGVLS
jgi:hypothetical protein